MDVKLETVSQVRRRLTFTIPASTVAAAFAAMTQRFAAKTRVPGFRPGKAPASMIERMHGTEIRRAVLDKLLQDHVFKAITQADVRPASQPEIESVGEVRRDLALPVTCSVEVLPDLHPTGYQGAELSVPQIVPDDADLEEALERKCRERAEYAPVEGGMEPGDEVTVDYALVPQGAHAGIPVLAEARRFTVGSGTVPAVVDEVVRGAKADDKLERTVTVAEDGHGLAAGTEVALTVTVREGQRLVIPALDDAFAVDVGATDLAALRAKTQEDLAREAERRNLELRRKTAIDHLLAHNPVEVPQAIVERLVDEQLGKMFGSLSEQQVRQLAGPLRQLRGQFAATARAEVAQNLLIQALATDAGVDVDEPEIETRLEQLVAEDPDRADALRRRYASSEGREGLKNRVRAEKAVDLVVAAANVTITGTQNLHLAREAEMNARHAPAPEPAHVHGPDCDHDHDEPVGHAVL